MVFELVLKEEGGFQQVKVRDKRSSDERKCVC